MNKTNKNEKIGEKKWNDTKKKRSGIRKEKKKTFGIKSFFEI